MELSRLRYFVAAAEEQSVVRAARRLRVAQPALTRQLQALEREVGARLLERHARGVRPTPAGVAFLEHAQRALREAEAALEAARAAAPQAARTVLRLSPPDWPHRARRVREAVERLRRVEPHVAVEYDPTPWVIHPRALLDDVIDLGFGVAMDAGDYGPEIAAERLLDEPGTSAVLPETHPLARRDTLWLSDLRDIPFLVPEREAAPVLHDQMVATVRRGGFDPIVRPAPLGMAPASQMIVAGAGWTITTDSVGSEPMPGVTVIPIADARVMLGFYLLHRAGDQRPVLGEFARHMRAALA